MNAVRANAAGWSTSHTRRAGRLPAAIWPVTRMRPGVGSDSCSTVGRPRATVATWLSTV